MIKILHLTKQSIAKYIYNYYCVLIDLKDSFITFIQTIVRALIGLIFLLFIPLISFIANIISIKDKKVIVLSKENINHIKSRLDKRLEPNTLNNKVKYNMLLDQLINEIIGEYYKNK